MSKTYRLLIAMLALNAWIANAAKDGAPAPRKTTTLAQNARMPAQTPGDEDDVESELDDIEDPPVTPAQSEEPTPPTAPSPEEPPPAPAQADSEGPIPEEEAPSSASGEKIFDWSKYKGAKEVPHPMAEKGLIRITKDDVYIYRTDTSDQNRAASLRFGSFNPSNLQNPESSGQTGSTFDENYDQTSNPAIMFDYEWQIWKLSVGKLGLRAGVGMYFAQGNGHFVSEENQQNGLTPREIFTFWALPLSGGVVYRAQMWDRQFLVPYAEGGAMLIPFGEFRDDDKPPKWGGSSAAYYAGGLALNLTYFDAMSRVQLDREYGINSVYLTVEYRGIVAITQKYDFSSDLINAGLLMEF